MSAILKKRLILSKGKTTSSSASLEKDFMNHPDRAFQLDSRVTTSEDEREQDLIKVTGILGSESNKTTPIEYLDDTPPCNPCPSGTSRHDTYKTSISTSI